MSIVQSARPSSTSRSSLVNKGRSGTRRNAAVSGERKEYVLQPCRDLAGPPAQLIERTGPADAAAREQDEAVADPLRIDQLVDREDKRAPASRNLAQHVHHLARLSEVESVEWLVHEQQRMRSEQRQREHQPAAEAFRQFVDSLAQDR